MRDLTQFQERCLIAIAAVEEHSGMFPHGLAVKDALEAYYGDTINHGRLYPNLDSLSDMGLIEKSQRDRRTNSYQITDEGWSVVDDLLDLINFAKGDDVESPFGDALP